MTGFPGNGDELAAMLRFLELVVLSFLLVGSPSSTPPATRCNPEVYPNCPDFETDIPSNDPSFYPPNGFYREVPWPGRNEGVVTFWFVANSANDKDGTLAAQTLTLLRRLAPSLHQQTDVAIARPFWRYANALVIDAYVYRKDQHGQWHRNHSGDFVDELMKSGVAQMSWQ